MKFLNVERNRLVFSYGMSCPHFLDSFGSTSYDGGVMCELYSPKGIVRRQLVSRTNIMVKPRLCVLTAGHPRETINCLTGNFVDLSNCKNIRFPQFYTWFSIQRAPFHFHRFS